MPTFKYSLGDQVKLALSGERGSVIGRAEYEHVPPAYFVRYVAADGRQVEEWFSASALA